MHRRVAQQMELRVVALCALARFDHPDRLALQDAQPATDAVGAPLRIGGPAALLDRDPGQRELVLRVLPLDAPADGGVRLVQTAP